MGWATRRSESLSSNGIFEIKSGREGLFAQQKGPSEGVACGSGSGVVATGEGEEGWGARISGAVMNEYGNSGGAHKG